MFVWFVCLVDENYAFILGEEEELRIHMNVSNSADSAYETQLFVIHQHSVAYIAAMKSVFFNIFLLVIMKKLLRLRSLIYYLFLVFFLYIGIWSYNRVQQFVIEEMIPWSVAVWEILCDVIQRLNYR